MGFTIRITVHGYTPEETVTEEVQATNSSERCESCGRGSEVLAFTDPMVEPESGPANLCRRCLGWIADYEVTGASIRCDWDLGQPAQPAIPEVGRCESCEVDGLTIYRFRVADTENPAEDREVAVCRQCFAGGFAPANGYSLVIE